ncbi:glycerol-3-phosphate 1-O-acyltransferase PlsY [Thauera chlorobenzoica]|uniref:Glycerol-3-phosphate acyltransferase n=1 Tax=Thauera chlorobenzoica TaxID=96773 RepID=A0A1H5SDM7_9RHOO|nr:glycerol-3-phosphate 1-O-acyltransferase PlsY [Thauera chlorobenzoica]APR04851.1 Acyl-phosphate:glycerol-3-phosphate O-acyltransferase PlsY [Thauera chlorobenzoica]SEF48689.1 acyl-phosphate glycerol-3-phosphate acyltransferase [Thauera chlorobenzoica]
MSLLLLLLAAYLLGSIPFAIVTSKLFGLQDPRRYGSGNPGATNVLRSGNKAAAALTLLGDSLKGWLAVWAAGELGFDIGQAALAGLAAFLGHVFTVFLRFNGGKGVATALGVLAGVDGRIAIFCAVIWLMIAYTSRYSSVAALSAAVAAPLAGLLFLGPQPAVAALAAMAAVLIWRHKANIVRLRAGTEGKIGGGKG